MMPLINLFGMLLLNGCMSNQPLNYYYFSGQKTQWCAIVNGCSINNDQLVNGVRVFNFTNRRIISVDIDDFKVDKSDRFFFNNISFNPDDTITGAIKLCYYTGSMNSGYNAQYLADERKLKYDSAMSADETFDYYFFLISDNCDSTEMNLLKYWDEVNLYLLKNGIYSTRTGK